MCQINYIKHESYCHINIAQLWMPAVQYAHHSSHTHHHKTQSLHWVFVFHSWRNALSKQWWQNSAWTLRLKKDFSCESLQFSAVFKSCWSEIRPGSRPPAATGARALRKPCEGSSDGPNGVNSLQLGSPGCHDTSCYYQQLSGCSLFLCLCSRVCCWLLVLVSNIMLTLLCCYSVCIFCFFLRSTASAADPVTWIRALTFITERFLTLLWKLCLIFVSRTSTTIIYEGVPIKAVL